MSLGFDKRLRALAIDSSGVAIVLILVLGFQPPATWSQAIISVAYGFFHFLPYFFWNGQTFGKFTQRLRVVKKDGSRVAIWQALLREFLKMIFMIVTAGLYVLLNSFFISDNGEKGALHDLIMGTKVVALAPKQPEYKDDYLEKTQSMRRHGL